ncbi:hypothetical protein C8R47DRAFT_1050896 [Mycena vitilis]|nr:hypothetical protein C8R47DRAFT_1050896 [Mycena vitilis]
MEMILGEPLSISPENSDDESDSGSDGTDSTLDDIDLHPVWYPLQRVPRLGSESEGSGLSRSSSRSSESSSTSSVVYDIDFEQLIDDLLAEEPCPLNETKNTVTVAASSSEANDSLMIKCLHCSSDELLMLLRLNHRDMRQDPWNPVPHILCAVSRDERVFLCMQRLVEFNQPPLQTVSNYIDFFRQVLEGLTFLHEHRLAQLSCLNLQSYMVDLGPTTSSASAFDRTRYPVRYYFTNLADACEFERRGGPAFQKDVEDCAVMMDRLAAAVPLASIARKLNTLVTAMRTGTFDADASRKLFEALCKSLAAEVFDTRVPTAVPPPPDGATLTITPRSPPQTTGSADTVVTLPRKPKSTSVSPRDQSASPPRRARARSTDLVPRLRALGLDA